MRNLSSSNFPKVVHLYVRTLPATVHYLFVCLFSDPKPRRRSHSQPLSVGLSLNSWPADGYHILWPMARQFKKSTELGNTEILGDVFLIFLHMKVVQCRSLLHTHACFKLVRKWTNKKWNNFFTFFTFGACFTLHLTTLLNQTKIPDRTKPNSINWTLSTPWS